MTNTTATAAAARFARQEAILRDEIAKLNSLLGLTDAKHKVTFGYIGDLDRFGDTRTWMVFLPHPGRVGNAENQVGGFATGNLEGIVRTRRELRALVKGIKLAQEVSQFAATFAS